MLIPLITASIALFMILYERKKTGRSWPEVRGWWVRAALLNSAQVAVVFIAGWSWDRWLVKFQPWALHDLGNYLGGLLGYLAITFVFYWWHRIRHRSGFLWRWLHQIHHSPKRLEIITAFYKHPFELIADSILCSLIVYVLLGLNPIAASYAVLLSALAELFYHWNVKTPYWVGFIFQRPESHCIHHQQGVHAYNYADLPIWDMLFGTFRNPKHWQQECGLGVEGEHRLPEMLLGVDVSRKKRASIRKPAIAFVTFITLTAIGLVQIIGDLCQIPALKGIGMAINASPAPKVFCTANSLETFSSQFYLDWKDKFGKTHSLQFTSEIASKIPGPYNRRNVYGALLAYGPVLEASPVMRPLYEAILSYSMTGKSRLLKELGIDPSIVSEKILISLVPRPSSADLSHLNLKKEVILE
ncbi:MAG: sterol desaturase family protein [Rhabdochlamydiaceae bacterium]|nr:sterol desaturase family protein [Rhabdochlamydiaceae bacterium]